MQRFTFLFISILLAIAGYSQELVSVTLKGSRTKTQLVNQFGNPLIKNGAKYYTVLYTSLDAKGLKDTLSGLLTVPDDLRFKYPRIIYQHGTSDCKKCVPSLYGTSGAEEGQLGLIGAGFGYIAYLPDYVGMGNGRGFQTYVHAATIQRATDDFLTAVDSWLQANNVHRNDQLFITGYSQGGYASMAYHKYVEETGRTVTAAAHLSGPYSLSGVMRDLILGDVAYFFPAYLPNTALGMQEAYGDLYDNLSDIFKPEFASDIQQYYNGAITLTTLNTRLIGKLNSQFGSSVAKNMLQPDFLTALQNDSTFRINEVLKENDVFRWSPKAPTKIYYCKADDQVPYLNSVVAYDTMKAMGAVNLELRDINSVADHGACFNPALTNSLLFFLTLQQITTATSEIDLQAQVTLAPNPASDKVQLSYPGNITKYELFDFTGQLLQQGRVQSQSTAEIDINNFNAGLYILRVHTGEGYIIDKKLSVQ